MNRYWRTFGSDYGFRDVFSQQVQANGRADDLFIAISASGNSESILQAIAACKDRGIAVAGQTDQSGGKMKDLCVHCLCVPSASTPRIQECHMIIEHTICAYVEAALFGKAQP